MSDKDKMQTDTNVSSESSLSTTLTPIIPPLPPSNICTYCGDICDEREICNNCIINEWHCPTCLQYTSYQGEDCNSCFHDKREKKKKRKKRFDNDTNEQNKKTKSTSQDSHPPFKCKQCNNDCNVTGICDICSIDDNWYCPTCFGFTPFKNTNCESCYNEKENKEEKLRKKKKDNLDDSSKKNKIKNDSNDNGSSNCDGKIIMKMIISNPLLPPPPPGFLNMIMGQDNGDSGNNSDNSDSNNNNNNNKSNNKLDKTKIPYPDKDFLKYEQSDEFKKLEFEWIGSDVKNIDDLIELGKTFDPVNRKRNNINLRRLANLVDPLEKLQTMIGMSKLKKSIFELIIKYLQ